MLQEEGFAAKTASDGREALDLLLGGLRPCAILLDLMMPGMNGWDFRAEQMRVPELAEIPVAVLSASYNAQSTLAQFGDVEFFAKPAPMSPRSSPSSSGHCRARAAAYFTVGSSTTSIRRFFCSVLVGVIRDGGSLAAVADGGDAAAVDALGDQVGAASLRALQRERSCWFSPSRRCRCGPRSRRRRSFCAS